MATGVSELPPQAFWLLYSQRVRGFTDALSLSHKRAYPSMTFGRRFSCKIVCKMRVTSAIVNVLMSLSRELSISGQNRVVCA